MPERDEDSYAADEARWSVLMASAQSGNESDYRQLLTELAVMVSRYLTVRLGGYDFIEDCTQDVLIAIHQARHTYDPGRRFRPWLFAIIRHKAIDAMRRQQTRGKYLSQDAVPECEQAVAASPEDLISGGRLINALSQTHREAITLTKVLGFSNAEAAARLAISESAMKVRVHRAVSSLRRLMEAEAL